MEKLTVFGPESFTLKPDREEVFKWLLCEEHLPCFDVYSSSWDEAVSILHDCVSPHAALLRDEDESVTLFITLGPEAEARITGLFEQQRYVMASLLNTLCDEMLFQMDRQAVILLEEALAPEDLHVTAWLEPMVDLSPQDLVKRFQPLLSAFPYARISHQGMLFPTKSMMYCVPLSHDGCQQPSLHDCSRCGQKNCLYRSVRQT